MYLCSRGVTCWDANPVGAPTLVGVTVNVNCLVSVTPFLVNVAKKKKTFELMWNFDLNPVCYPVPFFWSSLQPEGCLISSSFFCKETLFSLYINAFLRPRTSFLLGGLCLSPQGYCSLPQRSLPLSLSLLDVVRVYHSIQLMLFYLLFLEDLQSLASVSITSVWIVQSIVQAYEMQDKVSTFLVKPHWAFLIRLWS